MIAERRIPQAMLLTGPRGVGKLPLALALAKRILCDNATDFQPCSTCQSCLLADRLEHPDLHLIFPYIKRDNNTVSQMFVREFRTELLHNPYLTYDDWYVAMGESKMAQIFAQESDEIINAVNTHPFLSRTKVMLIWMAELMNETCANKILKILEEPPLDTVFILISYDPERLLQTIRSRCLRIEIPVISQDEMADAIRRRYDVDDAQLRYMVRAANGSWSALQQVISQTENAKLCFDLFVEMMRMAWSLDVPKMRDFSTRISKLGRNTQLQFLANTQRLLRENFICHVGMSDLSYMSTDEAQFASRFSRFIGERNILPIYDLFALAERQITQNVNTEIVIFHTIIKLYIYLHKA